MPEKIEAQSVRALYETQKKQMMEKPSAQQEVSCGKMLGEAVQQVQQTETDANAAVQKYVNGEEIDVHNVMILLEKANLNLRMAMQIRNKVIAAYEEIKRLQF